MADFKPNIYPIMYWGLMFGLVAGFVLLIMFLLSQYITTIWFPVFLAGVIWGGYRNYRKQKQAWQQEVEQPSEPQSAAQEIKEAAKDIAAAAKDMLTEQPPTTEAAREEPAESELRAESESDQSRNN